MVRLFQGGIYIFDYRWIIYGAPDAVEIWRILSFTPGTDRIICILIASPLWPVSGKSWKKHRLIDCTKLLLAHRREWIKSYRASTISTKKKIEGPHLGTHLRKSIPGCHALNFTKWCCPNFIMRANITKRILPNDALTKKQILLRHVLSSRIFLFFLFIK